MCIGATLQQIAGTFRYNFRIEENLRGFSVLRHSINASFLRLCFRSYYLFLDANNSCIRRTDIQFPIGFPEERSENTGRPFRENNILIQRRSASDQNDREVKNEQSLVYIAICVCTMEVIKLSFFLNLYSNFFQTMYYVMYCYGFIMNANFQVIFCSKYEKNSTTSAKPRNYLRVLLSVHWFILWCSAIFTPFIFNSDQTRRQENIISADERSCTKNR